MTTLRDKLGRLKPGPAGTVDAPELGPGASVHVRLLSLSDRERLAAAMADKAVPPMDRYRACLPLLLCEADGVPCFADGTDAAIGLIPGTLADRLVTEGARLNFDRPGEKKVAAPPSPTTPS